MPMFQPSASQGGALWAASPSATAVQLDGIKVMPPRAIVGATAFTVASGAAAGGSCYFKLTANGTNTPTFTGMVAWGGSAGWVNTAGTINNVQCFYDGTQAYYSITQNGSAPTTLPTFSSAIKSGLTAPGTLAITLSAAVANSGALDPLQFRVTTTNGGAQTDTVTAASAAAGTVLTLTTSRAATVGDTTTVTYDPTVGDVAKRLVDASGNLLFAWDNAPATVATFVGMLDGLGVSAAGAWGLRRLRTGYTGPLVRVTGSVQGAFDVGYTAGSGDLDMTRLTGASGETYLLNTVYDQSGNARDQLVYNGSSTFIRPTGGPKSSMPARILIDGAGKVYFAGTNLESMFLTSGRQGSQFVVQTANDANVFSGGAGGTEETPTTPWHIQFTKDGGGTNWVLRANLPTFFNAATNLGKTAFYALSGITTAASASTARAINSASGAKNVAASATGTASTTCSGLTRWGMFHGGGNGITASFLEQVQFATDVGTTVRDAIEENQRLYWSL